MSENTARLISSFPPDIPAIMAIDSASELAQAVARATARETVALRSSRVCGGGSIDRALLVELADGRTYFVKSGTTVSTGIPAEDRFQEERRSLEALRQVGCLRTPQVVGVEPLSSGRACLILEAIAPGSPGKDFWSEFGSGLAMLHRRGTSSLFGWESDNFIGSTPQPNTAHSRWIDFFRECRLEYQLKLARRGGHGCVELFRHAQRLLDRLDAWLQTEGQRPSLLHGDLWSGNYLVGADGLPVVIDPAAYYGAREADLAMPLLFGGFPNDFFAAYDEAWPLPDGWQDRVQIYQLYHLLNHLNMFGSGYLESCLEIVKRYGT
jgi:protein-ribulosamine 3-kinase